MYVIILSSIIFNNMQNVRMYVVLADEGHNRIKYGTSNC